MKEEIRFLYSQYFQLAEAVYLKKTGTRKEQIDWLKKKTAFYKVVGQYRYFAKEELKEKKELILKMIEPLEQVLYEQIEGGLFYLFTIQETKEIKEYDLEEKIWLHLWNCIYLDIIRQMIGTQDGKTPKLSLGPGFYHIDMETADSIYQLLEGEQYGIRIKNHMFTPKDTCCGLMLYGEVIKRPKEKPCSSCKGVNHCELCIYQ